MKALKLNISRKYREDMLPDELYEAARRAWSPSEENRNTIKYALIVAKVEEEGDNDPRGKVRALYEIESWEPVEDKKWCLSGKPADDRLWNECIGQKQALRKNSRSPFTIIDLHVFMEFGYGIKNPHIESALDYIVKKGKNQSNNILYVSDNKKPQKAYILRSGKKCGVKDVIRIAYCYSINLMPNDQNEEFSQKQCGLFDHTSAWWTTNKARKFLKNLGFTTDNGNSISQSGESNMKTTELRELLEQFYQIILYGPPGTGKTYSAKQILMELLNVKDKKALDGLRDYWDIVQFHPSYNYEDFVRGIKVEAQGGQPTYETVNRIFGNMCKNACEKKGIHVLIIDEINRANVSAVLGELIYALEYRDEKIKTPYLGDIIIPKNLYIIGTMNTADRTIGQIDYAVRRRFAFVHCGPKSNIVQQESPYALAIYDKTQKLFDKETGTISSDFDTDDVQIGHSYFLPSSDCKSKDKRKHVARKIIWQVVPILREYVKDGVLTEGATKIITEIKKDAENLESGESEDPLPAPDNEASGGRLRFYWENGDRSGSDGVGRTAFNIINDFIDQHPNMTAADLAKEFDPVIFGNIERVKLLPSGAKAPAHYFSDLKLLKNSNETVCISNEWGLAEPYEQQWNDFKNYMKQHGYVITQYRIVNINDGRQRLWEYCRKFNFVSAGGSKRYCGEVDKLQKGDLLFVCRVGNETLSAQQGCVAYCRVTSESPIDVLNILTPEGKLGDIKLEDGETYRQRFCEGREFPDKAVSVKWIQLRDDSPVKMTGVHRGFCTNPINNTDFKNLSEAFHINRTDSEE